MIQQYRKQYHMQHPHSGLDCRRPTDLEVGAISLTITQRLEIISDPYRPEGPTAPVVDQARGMVHR